MEKEKLPDLIFIYTENEELCISIIVCSNNEALNRFDFYLQWNWRLMVLTTICDSNEALHVVTTTICDENDIFLRFDCYLKRIPIFLRFGFYLQRKLTPRETKKTDFIIVTLWSTYLPCARAPGNGREKKKEKNDENEELYVLILICDWKIMPRENEKNDFINLILTHTY